jgi:hypothetical protein
MMFSPNRHFMSGRFVGDIVVAGEGYFWCRENAGLRGAGFD